MSRFIPPVPQPIVRGWGNGHFGIDYASPVGTPVKASGGGKVVFAGTDKPGGTFGAIAGKVIAIDHGEVWTEYAHLSVIKVKVGQLVKQGEVIALSGNTGTTTGPHLHFGFIGDPIDWNNGSLGRLNPDKYLKENDMITRGRAIRLLRLARRETTEAKIVALMLKDEDVWLDEVYNSAWFKAQTAKINAPTEFLPVTEQLYRKVQ